MRVVQTTTPPEPDVRHALPVPVALPVPRGAPLGR
jgi:hypothetical protein